MNLRGVLAFACTIWSVAAAAIPSPVPSERPEHGAYGTVINHSDPDFLWTTYGLNTSLEYKYYQEPGNDALHAHYDSRFFKGLVSEEKRSQTLTHIMHAYLDYFQKNDLETWIAHGTLLGWWWNGKTMPWDWDIDTQVSERTLFRLADDFNGTVVRYNTTNPDVAHSYLIDINPWARQRDRGKGLNIIDARWIDMQTGLYIDITGLSRLDPENPSEWQCKNNHKYRIDDIYPLRLTTFEGMPAKIPFRYEYILVEEYEEKALTLTHYHDHTWVQELEEWILDEALEEQDKEEDIDKDEDEDRQYE